MDLAVYTFTFIGVVAVAGLCGGWAGCGYIAKVSTS